MLLHATTSGGTTGPVATSGFAPFSRVPSGKDFRTDIIGVGTRERNKRIFVLSSLCKSNYTDEKDRDTSRDREDTKCTHSSYIVPANACTT